MSAETSGTLTWKKKKKPKPKSQTTRKAQRRWSMQPCECGSYWDGKRHGKIYWATILIQKEAVHASPSASPSLTFTWTYLQSFPPDLADDLTAFWYKFILDNLFQLWQHLAGYHSLKEKSHIPSQSLQNKSIIKEQCFGIKVLNT